MTAARQTREKLGNQDGLVRETYQRISTGEVLTGIAALMHRDDLP